MTRPDTILHASTVARSGRAVLLRGASGSGKSGLALQLIGLGAALVADDRTCLRREGECVMADAPDPIRGRIEARGVGLLNAPTAAAVPLALVVDLDRAETERLPPFRETQLAGLALPLLYRAETPAFPAAILIYLEHGRHA